MPDRQQQLPPREVEARIREAIIDILYFNHDLRDVLLAKAGLEAVR